MVGHGPVTLQHCRSLILRTRIELSVPLHCRQISSTGPPEQSFSLFQFPPSLAPMINIFRRSLSFEWKTTSISRTLLTISSYWNAVEMTLHLCMSVTEEAWKAHISFQSLSQSFHKGNWDSDFFSWWCSCKMVDICQLDPSMAVWLSPAAHVEWVTRGRSNPWLKGPPNFGLSCYCRNLTFLTNVSLFWLISFLRSPPESQPLNYTISHHCKLSFSYVTHIAPLTVMCNEFEYLSPGILPSPVAKTLTPKSGLGFSPWSGN